MSDYSQAALRDPCFGFIHSIMAMYGNPPEEVARFRQMAASAREKASGLEDRRWRKAYLGWCDYADRQIRQAEKSYAERVRADDLLTRSPPR